jgi:hypothetical protein
MAKLSLNNIASGFASTATLNANFDAIETALENTLSRNGTTPNQMNADLDMNSNGIINLASLDVSSLMINGVPVTTPELNVSEVPAQTGHSGKFLQTNGTIVSWQIPNSTEVTYDAALTGTTIRGLQERLAEKVSVRDFGAVGDGTTDDTTALQAALDSGAGIIYGVPGDTYKITQTGTMTLVSTVSYYCLTIPSNTTFDLNGATILRADDAIGIINENADSTQDTDITICNGWLDGDEANRGAPATGEMPIVELRNVLRPRVYNIKAKNARDYFGRFLLCDQGYFNNLHGVRSDGDGWSFGVSGTLNLTNCFIDNIYAEDCTNGVYGTLQGNPMLFTVYNCTVGKVQSKNCGGGIKIQGPTEDSIFGQLIFEGGVNGTANCGVKVQGQAGLSDVKRVSIGEIISEGSYAQGAYFFECEDISVNQINSIGDDTSGTTSGLRIDSSVKRFSVDTINIQTPGLAGADIRGDNIRIGNLTVKDVGQAAIANRYAVTITAVANGIFIDNLLVADDQATKTTDRFINTQSGAKAIYLGNLRMTGDAVVAGTYISNSASSELNIGNILIDDTPRYAKQITVTQVANVGTGEDDLCSLSLPAKWAYKDRQGWKITAWGFAANNANAKTVKLYFGSAAICTTAMTTNEASFWRVEAYVIRSAANTQQYISHQTKGSTTYITDIERGQSTESEASTITIKITGTATDNNDIINYGLIIEPI